MSVARPRTTAVCPEPLIGSLSGPGTVGVAVKASAVLFVAALTAALAQVSVPLAFTPVPLTLQPVVVLLGGAALGSRLGLLSQVLYLTAGVAGFPVFAASAGLPYGPARLLGPTGGYLLSYPVAAFLVGWLAERGFDRRYLSSVAALTAGVAVIFAGGVSWLAVWQPEPAGLSTALSLGFYPFVLADAVKILIGAAMLPAFWRLIGRSPGS